MIEKQSKSKLEFILITLIIIISLIIILSTVVVLVNDNGKKTSTQPDNKETVNNDEKDTEIIKGNLYQFGMSNVAAGYDDMYAFTENMEYYYFLNEMDGETRLKAKKGTWEIKDGKLILTTTKTLTAINGNYVDADASYGTEKVLVDYDLEVKTVNEVKEYEYKIDDCKEPFLIENGKLILNDSEEWYLGGYQLDEYFDKYVNPLNGEDKIIYHKAD
jgi:hypothetical protein